MKYAIRKTFKCCANTVAATGDIVSNCGPYSDINAAYREAQKMNEGRQSCKCSYEVAEID